MFASHTWATYDKGQYDTTQGLLKCGICTLAKEKGCHIWYGGKNTVEDSWVIGNMC